MVQRCEHLGFTLKASKPFRISREVFGQYFQRDIPVELRIPRLIHLAHPARANLGSHFIRSES